MWTRYNSSNIRKIEVAYKQIFKSFLKCKRENTTNRMIQLYIDTYDVIVRKLVFGFSKRVKFSDKILL